MATVPDLLEELGSKLRLVRERHPSRPLVLDWPELEAVLPDRGLPRGVVELSAPQSLGGTTSVALRAVLAGQRKSPRAWCAWLDPEQTLYAPGIVAAGVDPSRLLVVRSPRRLLGKVAVKIVRSGMFEVVVIDVDPIVAVVERGPSRERSAVPRAAAAAPPSRASHAQGRGGAPELLVRKLVLAAEPVGTTVLLLTDSSHPRAVPWPVALRLELWRPQAGSLSVCVVKDRRGRIGIARTVPFVPVAHLAS